MSSDMCARLKSGLIKVSVLFAFFCVLTGCGARHYYIINSGLVEIYLRGVEATQVFFVCSADGYQRHEAKRIDDQTWEIRVPADKEFKYFYIVDGVVYVPACRMTEADDFGAINCIYDPQM